MGKTNDSDLQNLQRLRYRSLIIELVVLIVVGVIVFTGFYLYHKTRPEPQPSPHVFTGSELVEQTSGVKSTAYIYDQNGKMISDVSGYGTEVSYTTTPGKVSNLDSRLVLTVGTNKIETAGNLIIAQPVNIDRISHVKNLANQIKGIKGIESQKVLLLETSSGQPIYAYHGYNVKLELSNIPNSTIFKVDGKYLFMANGSYAIIDASLLRG